MTSKAGDWLQKTLNYEFKDASLLALALTHRSAPGENNERLEFLGDAVLDVVVSEALLSAHPTAPEGDLSRLRAFLVNDTTLSEIASDLGVGEHLILGSGEKKTGGHRRESILADALEAIFGAVYLDAGFEASRRVIEHAYGERLAEFPDAGDLRDPKTRLQEWLQARQIALPVYELGKVSGQAHRQVFEVSCRVDGHESITTGHGSTRRNAEQQAAERMLEVLVTEDAR